MPEQLSYPEAEVKREMTPSERTLMVLKEQDEGLARLELETRARIDRETAYLGELVKSRKAIAAALTQIEPQETTIGSFGGRADY